MSSPFVRAARRIFEVFSTRFRLSGLALACVMSGAAEAQTPPSNIAALKSLSLAQLMDLEITSVSRRAEKLADTPSAIQLITAEEIHRSGSVLLPAALRLLGNLQVAQIDSRQWAITARGFNNTTTNKLLVLLDGRTLYTPLFAGVFWDVQDTFLLDIDRIEAISGPGATQWGSNAVNGVINITTKSAKDTQDGILHVGGGTELRQFAEARHGGVVAPGVYYRVYAKHFERDDSRLPNGAEAHDAWRKTQGGFRVDWDTPAQDLVTVQGDLYDGNIAQAARDRIKVSGANLVSRWTRTFAPKSEVMVQAFYDHTYRRIPGSVTQRLNVHEIDFQHRLPLGNQHDFMWGGTHRGMNDRITNAAALAFLPASVTRYWHALFAQNETGLLNRQLILTLGARAEHNPYTSWELQPSIRLAWKAREGHLLWGAVSRAMRTPSRIDRELFVPAQPPFTIAGGPDFQSEELLAYELGYRGHLRSNLTLSVSTFFHDYDDLRSLEPRAGQPSLIANGLTGRTYGAELAADLWVTSNWRLKGGYTELRVHSAPKTGSLDLVSVRSQALDPNRQFVLHSMLDLPANTTFDFSARHVARISNHNVPAYTEIDARISWSPTSRFEVALVGKNLLHARHPEFGAPATRREIQRSINGTVLWRF